MKSYPSIKKKIENKSILAFDKLDGSNIRAEWNPKKGFYKFGSRNQLIDKSTNIFGNSIPIIIEKYSEQISSILSKQNYKSAVCFFEFYGENSFAGQHNPNDKMDVTLIDVNPFNCGLISPYEFIKLFGHIDIPKVVYEGVVDKQFIDDVKNSNVNGITFEGVICKGCEGRSGNFMFKIKTNAWLDKLKLFCNGDMELFKQME